MMFAGGDVAFGPRIIITAVAEGKKRRIPSPNSSRPRARGAASGARDNLHTLQYRMKPDYESLSAVRRPTLPLTGRIGMLKWKRLSGT